MFPFPIPARTLQHITAGMVVEKPNPRFDTIDIVNPTSMLVFRPYRFATYAHGMDVANWLSANSATRRPPCLDMEPEVLDVGDWRERIR
jgi:hypothetical protein